MKLCPCCERMRSFPMRDAVDMKSGCCLLVDNAILVESVEDYLFMYTLEREPRHRVNVRPSIYSSSSSTSSHKERFNLPSHSDCLILYSYQG